MDNYYEILGCRPEAKLEELKESYHKLLLEYHPDKRTSSSEYFHKINEAWTTLRDPKERKLYDEILRQKELEEQTFLYGNYSLREMTHEPTTGMYSFPCRCGGMYNFTKKDFEEFNSYLVGCDQCSLMISVDLQT
ncbi:dnaJ homolog subfamily C member 24-like [Cimex lectularius]|uniref:Diphthamide biosynthesis protein 4 n=1 Tax=Cimex lectularius TaxID=79782 RepID=A0A8I6TBM7_CIMLE|nr:dnaJ homolog subfamily C member 24-like [Cimex lectularius]